MRRTSLVCLVLLWASCAPGMRNPNFGTLKRDERPFEFTHNIELFEVSNGLKVALIHEERTNLATVDVRYDVGAAEDPVGRAGLAHLVEHLMFEVRGAAGGPTLGEELGEVALYHNAWTSWDYTHYTTHVGIEHLQKAIALEARRLRFSCDELDDATFEREREVVRAEGRESASPMADAFLGMLRDIYGRDHPYTRAITSDEIATVTRDEVCAFIEKYYTPDRAYLVITGPYQPAKITALVGRVFGAIARRTPAPRAAIATPRLDGRVTAVTAPVTRPTALVFLPQTAWGADGTVKFDVGRRGLAAGLEKADDAHDWITATNVWVAGGWRAPVMVAAVEVKDASKLRAAADEVFARASKLLDGTSRDAFSDTLGQMTMAYVASWDDLPGRGQWISDFMQYTDHNWFMLKEMRAILDTPWGVAVAQLRGVMTRDRSHVVLLTPSKATQRAPAVAAVPSGSHDVTPWRAPVDAAEADRPAELQGTAVKATVEEYTLPNGLRVQLAPDPDSPIVDARLVFPVGSAHEPRDRPYLATAAARLLIPYPDHRYSEGMFEKLRWAMSHGTQVDENVDETATVFSVRGLAHWADWHVWFLSYLMDRGDYDKELIEEIHRMARQRGDSEDDEVDPVGRTFLSRLFGPGHPYALPEPDRAEAFLQIQHADLVRWRDQHFRVNGATLIVSGGFELAAMTDEIEQLFRPLPATPAAPVPAIPPPAPAKGPTWLAVEDERAAQTGIVMGFTSPSPAGQDEAPHAVLEEMIDDALRDVREGMGASYGVNAWYVTTPSGSVLFVKGEVDESKAETILPFILQRLEAIRAGGDDQRAAFVRARKKVLALAMGKSGGATTIAAELAAHAAGGYSKRHGEILASRIAALTLADVTRVAAADLADVRRVVLLRGKKESVVAAFAAVNATPERVFVPKRTDEREDERENEREDEAPAEPASADPDRTADPSPARDDGRPHRAVDGPRLSVGTPDGEIASDEFGLFFGTRKVELDEFLDIAGATDVKDRMAKRKWLRRGLFGGGALGAAITGVMLLTLDNCDGITSLRERSECQNRVSSQKSRAVVFVGVSAILAGAGATVGSGVPDNEELRRIATRYNQVVIAPEVTDKGAGLVISGRF